MAVVKRKPVRRAPKVSIPTQRPLLNLPPHPSGRPVRHDNYILRSRPIVPWDGAITPGLRRNMRTEAIGFHTSYSEVETLEDEWDE